MTRARTPTRRRTFQEVRRFERVGEARAALAQAPGTIALVDRGRLRNAVMTCPCGCGDLLTINLDPEAGKSWRVREVDGRLTLMPSVWRDGGCGSHFVLWSNEVWWCDRAGDEADDQPWPEVVRVTLRSWWRRLRRRRARQEER